MVNNYLLLRSRLIDEFLPIYRAHLYNDSSNDKDLCLRSRYGSEIWAHKCLIRTYTNIQMDKNTTVIDLDVTNYQLQYIVQWCYFGCATVIKPEHIQLMYSIGERYGMNKFDQHLQRLKREHDAATTSGQQQQQNETSAITDNQLNLRALCVAVYR